MDGTPVTDLLRAWAGGDAAALDALLPVVESELRRLARIFMARERRGHTLQATALVNEAFIRMIDARQVPWQHRAHFLGIAARLMRRVLVDHARTRGTQKRGGGAHRVPLADPMAVTPAADVDVLTLDRALEALAAADPRKAQVIEMRFFAGMTVDETAVALRVSPDTVMRDWRLARLWLHREMDGVAP